MASITRDPSDYQWLASAEAAGIWKELLAHSRRSPASELKWLRSRLDIPRAALLFEQLELMKNAERKFEHPEEWFWTKQLLEQASDEDTSRETARDFPEHCNVIDVCCGGGSDSAALAARGCKVTAIDLCPIACALAACNLNRYRESVIIRNAPAMDLDWDSNSYIHIDPDRRSSGQRSSQLSGLSPSWESISERIPSCRGLSLKLAPGMDWRGCFQVREQPCPQAIRFLSKRSVVRQQRWYWNLDRWPANSITTSILLNERSKMQTEQSVGVTADAWYHETFPWNADRIAGDSRAIVESLARYIGDYDPVLRAAHQELAFANRYGLRLLDSENGYLTADQPHAHPMVRWFEVLESIPFDRKRLRTFTKSVKARSWELKSRGVDVDLDRLRRELHVDRESHEELTLLIFRLGSQHRAVIGRVSKAQRQGNTSPKPDRAHPPLVP